MKMNQLIVTETDDNRCFLSCWNPSISGYETLSNAVFGKQKIGFCQLGNSETDFAVWFISSWGDVCKTPDHCSAVEDGVAEDKGLFYCLDENWYFRSYELDWEIFLGQKLIGKAFYYRQNKDGEIVLSNVKNGKVKTTVYSEVLKVKNFEYDRYIIENYTIFLKKENGRYDIIDNKADWVKTTAFKEYLGSDRFRLYLRRCDGSYDCKGEFCFLEDWDNALLSLNETSKKLELLSFDDKGLCLAAEGSKSSYKPRKNIFSQVESFWLGDKHYEVCFQLQRDQEEIRFIDWKSIKIKRSVRLMRFLKNLFFK